MKRVKKKKRKFWIPKKKGNTEKQQSLYIHVAHPLFSLSTSIITNSEKHRERERVIEWERCNFILWFYDSFLQFLLRCWSIFGSKLFGVWYVALSLFFWTNLHQPNQNKRRPMEDDVDSSSTKMIPSLRIITDIKAMGEWWYHTKTNKKKSISLETDYMSTEFQASESSKPVCTKKPNKRKIIFSP